MARLFHVNATTPALLLKALQANLQGRHPVLIGSLSARVGSIGDNRLGGWYVCLHPGTTDTALSKPFQARVPEHKLFDTAFVAERLLAVLGERTAEESGSFFDWAGKPVVW